MVQIKKKFLALFLIFAAMVISGCFWDKDDDNTPDIYKKIEITLGTLEKQSIEPGTVIEVAVNRGSYKISNITAEKGVVSGIESEKFYYTAPQSGLSDKIKIEYKDSENNIHTGEYEVELANSTTFMIYMGAQNNLGTDGFAVDDLKEIKSAGINQSNKNINILVYLDIDGTNNGLFLYDGNESEGITINSQVITGFKKLDYYGNGNTGTESELRGFLDYVSANFKSENYLLDMWSHGDGWRNYDLNTKSLISKSIIDDEGSGDTMNMFEVESAIKNSGLGYIDVLYFDACLMGGIESLYQLKDITKYVVASPELTPGEGGEYKGIISKINNKSGINSYDISKNIVDANWDCYYKSDLKDECWGVVFAVYDQSKMANLIDKSKSAMNAVGADTQLVSKIKQDKGILCYSAYGYNYNVDTIYCDIGDFFRKADEYNTLLNNDSNISNSVYQLETAISQYVVYIKKQTGRYYLGSNMYYDDEDNSTGLSFYMDMASMSGSFYNEYKTATTFGGFDWVQSFQNKFY